jgi:hypothetical protein
MSNTIPLFVLFRALLGGVSRRKTYLVGNSVKRGNGVSPLTLQTQAPSKLTKLSKK